MIIYSLTFAVEESHEQDWLQHMKSDYISKAMNSGYFSEYRFTRILPEQDLDIAYNIQFRCANKGILDEYLASHAQLVEKDVHQKFAGKFGTFFTLLEIL